MKRATVLLIIAVVLCVLVILGCASKSSPSTNLTSPPPDSTTTTLPAGQEPVGVVSVIGPIPPYNPGGPVVEITLKNVATESVISLTASLGIDRAGPPNMPPFTFSFQVTSANPLQPGKSLSVRQTLIGGGFSDSVYYPLIINGTLQSGAGFAYTKQVQITAPGQ